MDFIHGAIAVMFGFAFGLQLLAWLIRWVRTVQAQARASKPGVPPSLSDRVAVGMAALLSPAPWMLLALGVFAYTMLSRPHELPWELFFGSLAVSLPTWTLWVLVRTRRHKRLVALAASAANAPQDAEAPLKASTPTSPPTT